MYDIRASPRSVQLRLTALHRVATRSFSIKTLTPDEGNRNVRGGMSRASGLQFSWQPGNRGNAENQL